MTTQIQPVDHELIQAAEHVARTRCQGDNHTMAAAARARDGRIVTAVNAYHFTGGPCAELVVIGAAAAQGAYELDTIVAVGDRDRGVVPRAAGAGRSFSTTSLPSRSSSAKTTASEPSSSPTCSPKATSGPTTSSTPSNRATGAFQASASVSRSCKRSSSPAMGGVGAPRGLSADAAIQSRRSNPKGRRQRIDKRAATWGYAPVGWSPYRGDLGCKTCSSSVRGDACDRAASSFRLRLSISCR